MAGARDWDYSLRLQGVTFEGLGMARLAEYLAKFAELLGDEAKPVFAGAVRGSVVLRARDRSGITKLTRSRIRRAAEDDDAPGHRAYEKLSRLMVADGARGTVLDRNLAEVIRFPTPAANDAGEQEVIIHDTAAVVGVVVGVEGIDDTAHIRLQDQATGVAVPMQVRDMALAREAASHFRGSVIRIHVHGTWRRGSDGKWVPHSLYADAIEPLEQVDARAAFRALREIKGTGWAELSTEEADRLCADLRGDA